MKVIETPISGLIVLEPRVLGDSRGFFLEIWQAERYKNAGIPENLVQDNLSFSRRGVLRGLHMQNPHPQGKLVTVLEGEVFDVAVDLRAASSSFGKWHGILLCGERKNQFYIPPGFAHGFVVLSETALFHYKCSEYYSPQNEFSVAWDDPDIGIQWPWENPVLSEKDKNARRLRDIPAENLRF